MSYFEFEQRTIYYSASGTGPPLLFLHGNAASSNMFFNLAGRYEKDFHVVLPDFLGHGQSDRLDEFPADLWFYEARQVIALLREMGGPKANLIGSSGGALVAINVALEAPELVEKVIADSFEGEVPLKAFTKNVAADRARSKQDESARLFFQFMHGDDWERVVDCDTAAVIRHDREVGRFFHRNLQDLKADILMTGSREDEFTAALDPDYLERLYRDMLQKIGHGRMHIFDTGGHPAMLTNPEEFYRLSMDFFGRG